MRTLVVLVLIAALALSIRSDARPPLADAMASPHIRLVPGPCARMPTTGGGTPAPDNMPTMGLRKTDTVLARTPVTPSSWGGLRVLYPS